MSICDKCGKSYYPSEGEGHEELCDECTCHCIDCGEPISYLDNFAFNGLCSFCYLERLDNDEL